MISSTLYFLLIQFSSLLVFEFVNFCFLRVTFIMAIPRVWFVVTEEHNYEYTRVWHGRRDVRLAPPRYFTC